MATSIITGIAGNLGSSITRTLGVSNIPIIGSKISGLINNQFRQTAGFLSNELFGEEVNKVKGSRLTDLTVQTSTYGDIIPIVFGRVKLAGNIIWSTDIKEIPVTTTVGGSGKGGATAPSKVTQTTFQYKVTFAVALCEGEISSIERIWADSDLINLSDYCSSYTLYKGSATQLPDPVIESYEGIGSTPAYRDLAYIVLEDFDMSSFGNRIPNLSFEINRPVKGSFNGTTAVEDLVTAIDIIPGSGEFVYDTVVQTKIYGTAVNNTFIQRGGSEVINMNNSNKKADALVSVDQLLETFSNLQWVSIICTWFASSTDANATTIEPRVEYKLNTTTSPDVWSVGSYNRDNTTQVTLNSVGSPIYGGTPSDSSILRLIDELKNRGLKVMFYPMIFVDQSTKPWRGRITTSYSNIANFFTKTKGYNEFISHYANLLVNKVDAFIIGSEMKGLTQVKDGSNNFPAVTQFINLAASVKSIMGSGTKITYAADWSEYHSTNGWYNLDPLWASSNIDMIGIDAYFPLTNRPQNGIYDLQEVENGWTSGEGYDWYYSDPARTTQVTLQPQYAWKNIAWWWNNTHTNPNSVQTAWTPQSKKIWFTEFGFPSVDGATNQPNVFYNPESSESALPYFSEGYNDFTAQRLGIEASLLKWQNSNMVEQKFLWTWDARPYPFWPDLNDVWGDGDLWSKGHWVNGKLGGAILSGVVAQICEKCGLTESDIYVGSLQKVVDGYIINNRVTGLKAIEKLSDAFFFDSYESDGILQFILRGEEKEINLSEDDLIGDNNSNKKLYTSYLPYTYLPSRIDVNFIDRENNYNIGTTSDNRDSISRKQLYEINYPLVLTGSKAKTISKIALAESWISRKTLNFSLPINHIELDVGDVISLSIDDNQTEKVKIEKINLKKNTLEIQGKNIEKFIYELLDYNDFESSGNTVSITPDVDTIYEILDISALPGDDVDTPILRFAVCGSSQDWQGAEIFFSQTTTNYQSLGTVQVPSTQGSVASLITDASPFIWDEFNEIEVYLINGTLSGITSDDVLNGGNMALIGDEIIQFREATLIEANRYKIKGLLRGRLGTESKTANHLAGERFVLLNEFVFKTVMQKSLIGSPINIKIVTFGKNINEVTPATITYNAKNLVPYSVAHFEAAKNSANDINFSWIRRCREFSAWKDYIDVPLDEATEQYICSIVNSTNQIVRQTTLNTTNFNYTSAMQVSDFGSTQNSIKARCYQYSANVGLGGELEKVFNL